VVVPLYGRPVAAVAGALLVLAAWASVVGTVIVPRPVGSWLTRWVDQVVTGAFWLATGAIADHRRRPSPHPPATRTTAPIAASQRRTGGDQAGELAALPHSVPVSALFRRFTASPARPPVGSPG
jgi:hypothetical protein